MKNVREWKVVDGTPIYVWTGAKVPTTKDIQAAPMFTIFPGTKTVSEIPSGGQAIVYDRVPAGEVFEEDGWFVSEVSGSERWTTMDTTVIPVLVKAGIGTSNIQHEPQHNDLLTGERVTIGGETFTLAEDRDVQPIAIEAGWTLIKLPDELGSKYWSTYALDDLHEKGRKFWWTQTPLRSQLLGSVSGDAELLGKANRYRRSMGQSRDLQPGEWTDADLRELLGHARPQYRNPQDVRYQQLKASLMR